MSEDEPIKKVGIPCAIGIDPGLNGAIVSLINDGVVSIVEATKMPSEPKQAGKGRQVNAACLIDDLSSHCARLQKLGGWPVSMVGVELVHANPGQGVTAMFSFGRSLGVVHGCVASLYLPQLNVRPGEWKKAFGLSGKDKSKELSVTLFKEQNPRFDFKGFNKEYQLGVADAYFIARYALRSVNG